MDINEKTPLLSAQNILHSHLGYTLYEIFTSNNNEEWRSLTKEELINISQDPFWKCTRLILMVGFWVLIAAMLMGATISLVTAPLCTPSNTTDTTNTTIFQQEDFYANLHR